MRKLYLFLLLLMGCTSDKTSYSDWETDRFLVFHVGNTVTLNTFKDGELIQIDVPRGDYKKGETVSITYRKVTKIICSDTNCRREESYEVK